MKTKNSEISIDEFYHIFNRGVEKQPVFLDKRDFVRFLFLILYFQSPINFFNLSRPVTSFVRSQAFNIDNEKTALVLKSKTVSLKAFCLMPNHFHLLIQEIEENGIARYMQRILTAYAKYFNTKYNHNGHVFQGTYRTNHVEDNDQLLYLSAYIHKNPPEYFTYPWSSFSSYSKVNPWPKLLDTSDILNQFETPESYISWVQEASAKDPEMTDVLDV